VSAPTETLPGPRLVEPTGSILPSAPLVLLAAGAAVSAATLGILAAAAPVPALVLLAAALVVTVVWRRPAAAAYLAIGVTPLVVGIDRDRLVPMLRPNEALVGFLVLVLLVRAAVRMRPGARPSLRLGPVALSVLLLAVTSSVLPLMFMVLRGRSVEMDDITNAAVLWKYLALYALVRYTVRSEKQVRISLWVSMVVTVVVGVIAILQSLDLLGVRDFLAEWYAPFGEPRGVDSSRAGSTVGLPAAMADLMIFNLAVAIGIGWRRPRLLPFLAPMALVYVLATFSAAEFSSMLGLLIAMVCVATLLRRLDLLRYGLLVLPVAVTVLWPTISTRLVEFGSMHGLPDSWLGRWYNLSTYFWPQLFSGTNPLVGVRPAARVPVHGAFGFVWIESGYTWLLWGGGVPLFLAYCYFVRVAFRSMKRHSRPLSSYSAVAALAACTGVVVVVVLMIFDPHITYRGAADALFVLLALALTGSQDRPAGAEHESDHGREGT
jgi:hypothetical protein